MQTAMLILYILRSKYVTIDENNPPMFYFGNSVIIKQCFFAIYREDCIKYKAGNSRVIMYYLYLIRF